MIYSQTFIKATLDLIFQEIIFGILILEYGVVKAQKTWRCDRIFNNWFIFKDKTYQNCFQLRYIMRITLWKSQVKWEGMLVYHICIPIPDIRLTFEMIQIKPQKWNIFAGKNWLRFKNHWYHHSTHKLNWLGAQVCEVCFILTSNVLWKSAFSRLL